MPFDDVLVWLNAKNLKSRSQNFLKVVIKGREMITLLGALVGFLGSVFPDVMRVFRDHQDKKHEIALLSMQIKWQKNNNQEVLQALEVQATADQMRALYQQALPTGVQWVDALAGTVRPFITYAFFVVYGLVKYAQGYMLLESGLANHRLQALLGIWNSEDQALFAAVMSFWFGQRALLKNKR